MPQSGKVNLLVKDILIKYKEHCREERKRERDSNRAPPPLLSMSFAQAKDWLIKQQRANAEALTIGIVNEESREITTELNISLSDQSATTSALLQQPARSAAPVIPISQLSLGPEAVTNGEHMNAGNLRKKGPVYPLQSQSQQQRSQHQRRERWSLQKCSNDRRKWQHVWSSWVLFQSARKRRKGNDRVLSVGS